MSGCGASESSGGGGGAPDRRITAVTAIFPGIVVEEIAE
jgi:hypothetical protein